MNWNDVVLAKRAKPDSTLGRCWALVQKERSRRLLAERRLREARACLRYISEGADCEREGSLTGLTCNDIDTIEQDSPCAPCAARRGLKRVRAVNKPGKKGEK